jgi:hypothetical protein
MNKEKVAHSFTRMKLFCQQENGQHWKTPHKDRYQCFLCKKGMWYGEGERERERERENGDKNRK